MLLITGCPRSGTRYAAAVFQAHGIQIGHEVMGPDGTSDWHLAGRPWPGEVLHQVRNPKDVIASLATIDHRSVRYMRWRAGIRDGLDMGRLRDRCRLWLAWTDIVGEADYRYRVEDMRSEWMYLQRACPTLRDWSAPVPTNINHRPHDLVTWAQIADTAECGAAVIERAREYGYEVNA